MTNPDLPKIHLTPREGDGHFNTEIMPLAFDLCDRLDQLEQDALDGKDISISPIITAFGDTANQFEATAYVWQEFDNQIKELGQEPNVQQKNRLQFRRDITATIRDIVDLRKSN